MNSIFKEYKNSFLAEKYIFLEFLFPFIYSLSIFLCINVSSFVLFGLIDLAVKYGISIKLFFQLFIYSLPEMIFYSIPMSFLLATLLASVRLTRDNELIMFQMTGKSIIRLFLPVIVFALFLSLFMIAFNNFLVSKSNHEFSKNLFYAQVKRALPINKKNIFYKEFEHELIKRTFYAKEFNENVMYKPVVQEFSNNEMTRIIVAEQAILNKGVWNFKKGTIYNLEATNANYLLNFEQYSFSFLASLVNIAKEVREPKEMNFQELAEYINNLKNSGENTGFLEVQLHQKMAIPFTTFLFCLTAIPLGTSRKTKNTSFSFAFSLFFIFGYYILMFITTALGSLNFFNPILCAWLPNIVVLLFSFVLICKFIF